MPKLLIMIAETMKNISSYYLLSDLKLNDLFLKGDGLYISINSKGKLAHKYTYFPNWQPTVTATLISPGMFPNPIK